MGSTVDEHNINIMTSFPPLTSPPSKRGRKDENLNLLFGNDSTTIVTPCNKFLLMNKVTGNFNNDSPFYINKHLDGLFGTFQSIKKLRDGSLLIETSTQRQAEKILACTSIKASDMSTNVPVKVELHKQLNFSKGMIYCYDLLNCSVETIKEELKDQGVTDVYRIHSRRDGQLVPTPSHILTFCTPQPPSTIQAAYYRLQVRPYIPSPLRCYKCQKFGHSQNNCSFASLCANCGQNLHEDQPCTRLSLCVNCNGTHSARSRDCPKYKEEFKIQEIRTSQKISFAEAKRKYRESIPSFTRSFASITAIPIVKVDMSTQTCDMSTQTVEISPCSSKVVVNKINKEKKSKKSPSARSRSPVNKTKSPVKKVILNRDSTKTMTITPIVRSSSADSVMEDDITRPPHHRSDVARKKTK